MLYSEKIVHLRQVYGWLDLISDLGGVTEIIGLVFGFFLLPVSYHSFIVKASQHLLFARTKDDNLFRKSKKDQEDKNMSSVVASKDEQPEVREEIQTHRKIRIKFFDNLILFIS